MSAIVESRRFRTWDESRPLEADHRVRLLVRIQALRYQRNWYFWVLVAAAVVFALIALLTPFLQAAEGWVSAPHLSLTYAVGGGILAGAVMLLVAAPTIAEDLRFNAPLFYFSRPVRVGDYLTAKLAFIALVLLVLVGTPLLLMLGGALLTLDTQPPAESQWCDGNCHERRVALWESEAMNSVVDWLFVSMVLVTGTFSIIVFATALMVMVSSLTRRAWHAAVAFIVVALAWGMIGMGVGFVVSKDAMALVWGPFGWAAATLFVPIGARFDMGEDDWTGNATTAAFLSHLLLWGWAALFVFATSRRLRRVEGAL